MPERKDSVDSFDEFFGASKNDDDRRRSPIKRKESDVSVKAIVKNQPAAPRPKTPPTPEERKTPSPKPKPAKVNNTKPSVTTNGNRDISPISSKRAESVQSKAYESDFDEEHGFEEDEITIESTHERNKKHSSVPPAKERAYEAPPRRGSDSELKSSYSTTQNNNKPSNNNIRRKANMLPYIKPQQTRRVGYPIRRNKEIFSSSAKNEAEQRAASARNNKIRSLESRLAELRQELENQRIENATLRTIQRREEKAIKKYEEKEYDVHRMVRDFTHEIDHMKQVLMNERETKAKLEKQIETRDEKLRDQTKRLEKYKKVVKEKNLDERYELREKLNETDKKLQELQEKLTNQEKYIEHLEKNHRHEVHQEIAKQRELKRQLETQSQKYNELITKLEDKTRQMDTMQIYAQRGGKRRSDSPTNLGKTRSLQSLNDTSPRFREKANDSDKKRREQQERKAKTMPQRSTSNDVSPKHEKKKSVPKKESQNTTTTKNSSNDETSLETSNGPLPPKGKPPTRRLSTPKSIEDEKIEGDDEDMFGSRPKKLPPPTVNQRNEHSISHAQIHKRPIAPIPSTKESKSNSSGTGGNTSSSIFKLTEPPVASKSRVTRPLDDKWSDMFGTNEKEDSTKEDLLAKLVADEQQERRLAAAQPSSTQRPSMSMFESSTHATTITQPPSTTAKPSNDTFESLFGNNSSSKPTANRTNGLDDIFSTKPSNQSTAKPKNDTFDALFGPSSTTTVNSDAKQNSSQNDRLQRPKVVTTAAKPIPNRAVLDELEDFTL